MDETKPGQWIPFLHADYEMAVYRRDGIFMELFLVDRIGSAPISKFVTPRDALIPKEDFKFPYTYQIDIDERNGWEEPILETSPVLDGAIMYYWHIRGRFRIQGW